MVVWGGCGEFKTLSLVLTFDVLTFVASLQEKQCSAVRSTLDRAEGFVDTGEQERFDECEAVMIDISRKIKTVGSQWKVCILPN